MSKLNHFEKSSAVTSSQASFKHACCHPSKAIGALRDRGIGENPGFGSESLKDSVEPLTVFLLHSPGMRNIRCI